MRKDTSPSRLPRGSEYWDQRFCSGDTPWELNAPSVVLREACRELFSDQQSLCGLTILSPGCGSGSDAIEFSRRGARVVAVDWSASACQHLQERIREGGIGLGEGTIHVVQSNFFELVPEPVDIVCEHTFFCAIEPDLRSDYVETIERWLRPGGYLIGNFFVVSAVEAVSLPGLSLAKDGSGPPFAVSEGELTRLLSSQFKQVVLRPAAVGEESRRPGLEWVGVFQRI